jgi:HK97 family phage prohead protease
VDTFLVNDHSKNCYGCRIATQGIDTDQFLKNPIMLYDHDSYKRLPIGTWKNLKKEAEKMFADPEFDSDDEFAVQVKNKVTKNIIKMASVSIEPVRWEEEADGTINIIESILHEISIVPFGGNKNAFKLCDNKGNRIEMKDAKEYLLKLNNSSSKPVMAGKNENSHELLCAAMNLSENTTSSELITKVLNLSQRISSLESEKTALLAEKQQLQDKIDLADKHKKLDTAVAEKRITLAQKESFLNLSMADLDTVLNSIPKAADLSNVPNNGGRQELNGRENWTFNDYSKNDPEALAQIKLNDKPEYARMFKAQFGVEPSNV